MQTHGQTLGELYSLFERIVALHACIREFLSHLEQGGFIQCSLDTLLLVNFSFLPAFNASMEPLGCNFGPAAYFAGLLNHKEYIYLLYFSLELPLGPLPCFWAF